MAINGRLRASMEDVFPFGAYLVSEVSPARDFEKSTRERLVQAIDKATGLPLFDAHVMDVDPAAGKRQKIVTVKIAATYQPVPPAAAEGSPFVQVEFENLTVTPYVDDTGGRARVAYSIRATGMRAPARGPARHAGAIAGPDGKAA